MLQVALDGHELAQIQASDRAQGRSLQDHARDTLLTAAQHFMFDLAQGRLTLPDIASGLQKFAG